MIYNIEYQSLNEYEKKVKEAIFQYLILPCNEANQNVLSHSLKSSSESEPFFSKNSFGFETLRIRTKDYFNEFLLTLIVKVEKYETPIAYISEYSLEEQLNVIKSKDFYLENFMYFKQTLFTNLSLENKKLCLKITNENNLLAYYSNLSNYIRSVLTYKTNITSVHTTANDVLALKSGVCQDFTHLYIAMARENGLPCRYVSGYLDQGSNYIGSSMMHAWAEVYIPGLDWVGFDPTNNIRVNSNYIKVSHGNDYSDCSPLRGVLLTNGKNKTSHQVKVTQQ